MPKGKLSNCFKPACSNKDFICPECESAPEDKMRAIDYNWDPARGRVEVTVLKLDRPPRWDIDTLYAVYRALNKECKPGYSGYSDEFIVVPHSLYNLYRICTDVSSLDEAHYVMRRATELFKYYAPEFQAWYEMNKVE